jgi:serine/threonine protein kinase
MGSPIIHSPGNSSVYFSARNTPVFGSGPLSGNHFADIIATIQQAKKSEYHKMLEEKAIHDELEWSGKGQHVVFDLRERVPLDVINLIGWSSTAQVHKVKCRRIILARKLITTNRRFTLGKAMVELEHLHRLRHAHIVQLVGSYVQGREFAILLYPCADMDLNKFMEKITHQLIRDNWNTDVDEQILALRRFFSCLSQALAYIHSQTTKHMDIKPSNILVKRTEGASDFTKYRTYIADFGISRNFATSDHSQTEGPTAMSVKYCAPEVARFESRGRSADIFSMGCVFYEMATVIMGFSVDKAFSLEKFEDFRCGDGDDDSFQANIPHVKEWGQSLVETSCNRDAGEELIQVLDDMVNILPGERPTAETVARFFSPYPCCTVGREEYVVESMHSEDGGI